ncbi:MAG: carbon monoxide dehydrogenase, partial [Alphaproteobacteria bacterium]|nr:carbon monoxide dehydrogenase [Alphaproteobacteria bacterium]
LRASIPGCEELQLVSENELTAKVTTKIGPVKQKFNGDVFLENVDAPHSYTLRGEGKGTAGFAKGAADVQLEEAGHETVLRYQAKADVGGKLAQLGSRLVKGSAQKMADDFFDNFVAQVGGPPPEAEAAPPEAEEAPKAPAREVPARAAAAAAAAKRATEERLKGGPAAKPLWQRPVVVGVAVVVVLLLILILS